MSDTITIQLEPATREDFILGTRVLFGNLFYLKSQVDAKFSGPYRLKNDKNHLNDFANYLQSGMVYIQKRRI